MKKIIYALVVTAAVFASDINFAAEKDSAVSPAVVTMKDRYKHVKMPEKNLLDVAKLGEKLVYVIKWKGIPAGEATFSVKPWQTRVNGRSAYYVVLETESNDFVSTFYKVRDKIKSFIDADTGHSLYFARNIREGSYAADDFLQFDYEKNLQHYSSLKEKDGAKRRKQKAPRPIPGYLQDPLSVIYYLRHFPLTLESDYNVLVGGRKHTGILKLEVLKEEKIKLPGLGEFDAVAVNLASGEKNSRYNPKIFVAKGKVTVWVEKNTNIPIMINVGVPILGTADVVLKRSTNSPLNKYISTK
ncbi:MAG: DUF3108 domain-containing protein [Planctomycetota bacterium]